MGDHLIRGTALNGKVRAFAVQAKELVETLRQRHDTCPTATAALGRTAAAGAMMGAMLKDNQKLTIQIKGDGPIGQIVVDADASGCVRGYVDNPRVELPLNERGKLDVAGAVGREGQLYVIKDMGLKEPYRGQIPIVSGELAEDFTYYFAKSEQTPSAVGLGVLVDTDHTVRAAGGWIIQLMPGLEEHEIASLEKLLAVTHPVTELLDQGLSLEQVLATILPDFQVKEQMDIVYRCKCSRERVETMLASLGAAELNQLIEDDGQAEVVCHFCNEPYQFGEAALREIVEKL